jgi:hypothetical protein
MELLIRIIQDDPLLVTALVAITLLSIAVTVLAWIIIGVLRRK